MTSSITAAGVVSANQPRGHIQTVRRSVSQSVSQGVSRIQSFDTVNVLLFSAHEFFHWFYAFVPE